MAVRLAHLHLAAGHAAVPQALWRDRLALAAAEICAGFTGRREGQAALRDAVLAKSTGRDHILPLLAVALKSRDLRLRGDDLRLACHRAVVAGAGQAVPLAADLARRAARLQAVVPKLRAKGAERAVDLFLTRDALAPAALTFMSDRAARRFCDRLVDLGAVRELTGRQTFRLYGL